MIFLITIAFTLAASAASVYLLLRYLKLNSLGESPITTHEVAYDTFKFGNKFTWDKHCFYINGRETLLFSGEFHYWRLPDQSRWKSMLMQYKAGGLNCIRIYFHWGFHSPDENVYLFDEGRDVEYLLSLCEELELFVLAAPGPYICAETQAGGIPLWLAAKRDVRIRHSVITGYRKFDQKYMDYSIQWFDQIMPILAKHQITTKDKGCILAIQIENEVFDQLKGISVGMDDDMKILAKSARDNGITVPLFTNDAFENGSYISRPESEKIYGKSTFGLDLYGFDKYVVFCPTSSPFASIVGANKNGTTWGDWDPKDVMNAFESTERTIRGFGGGAAESPIFIPELQGGWFNHYTLASTYDDVYNYYGSPFTKMVLETALSQGSTAFSIYMFYGGTNWGTLGDPDVYTSYDYSACIREYGHFSKRGRFARLALLFAKSFEMEFAKTETSSLWIRDSFLISSDVSDYISKQRRGLSTNPVYFLFFRNFSAAKRSSAIISFKVKDRKPILLKSKLPYKQSFIGLANYYVKNIRLLISTIPIHAKLNIGGNEVWIIQCDDSINGQFAFADPVKVSGDLAPIVEIQDGATVVSFAKNSGNCNIEYNGTIIHLIALTGKNLLTLGAIFKEAYWAGESSIKGLFWGCYGIKYDVSNKMLIIQQSVEDEKVYGISKEELPKDFTNDSLYAGISFLKSYGLKSFLPSDSVSKVVFTEKKQLDFKSLPWKPVPMLSKKEHQSMIDFCYTSGHAVYKLEFRVDQVPKNDLSLELNLRHRGSVYINGTLLGNQMTYALSFFRPGAKNGPDFGFGQVRYSVPLSKIKLGVNEIVIIVESLGLNRAPGPINDVRVPRGLISAKLANFALDWYIAGVDVRKLSNTFNHTGIPCEQQEFVPLLTPLSGNVLPLGVVIPTVFQGTFTYDPQGLVVPLRLHVEGNNSAMVTINGYLIARYYGNGQGPQTDFYIPDGILKKQNKVQVLTYGTDESSNLSVNIDVWKIDGLFKSGNVQTNGVPFILKETLLKF